MPFVGAQVPCFTKRAFSAKDAKRTEHRRRLTFIGKRTMSDLQEISRVLYRHDWTSIDQWVSKLDQLADLTDDQITELERLGKHQSGSSCEIGARLSPLWRASQGTRSPTGFWKRALTSLRWC